MLIEGINPLVIAKIVGKRFERCGAHPYYYTLYNRLYKAKFPILSKFRTGAAPGAFYWAYVEPAKVRFWSASDKVLWSKSYKSNTAAAEAADKYRQELSEFVTSLTDKQIYGGS